MTFETHESRVELALDGIHGPRETYRPLLDAGNILRRICRNAEGAALRRGTEPWVIISEVTGHGSGVSNAIYRVYGVDSASESTDEELGRDMLNDFLRESLGDDADLFIDTEEP